MTTTKINPAAYREICREIRSSFERWVESGVNTWDEYRDTLRDELEVNRHLFVNRRPAFTVEDLRAELRIAARNAYLQGATDAQVDEIVRLSSETGEIRPAGYTRLTKQAASRIISDLRRAAG